MLSLLGKRMKRATSSNCQFASLGRPGFSTAVELAGPLYFGKDSISHGRILAVWLGCGSLCVFFFCKVLDTKKRETQPAYQCFVSQRVTTVDSPVTSGDL